MGRQFGWIIEREEPEPEVPEEEEEEDEEETEGGETEQNVTVEGPDSSGDDDGPNGGLIAFLVIFFLALFVGIGVAAYYYKKDPEGFKAKLRKLKCTRECCNNCFSRCRGK